MSGHIRSIDMINSELDFRRFFFSAPFSRKFNLNVAAATTEISSRLLSLGDFVDFITLQKRIFVGDYGSWL